MKPKETVQALLNDIRNPKTVRELCAQDVTYVSLNYSNPDLHKIMPWCGTGHGVDAISKTFHDVSEYWSIDSFMPEAIFGEDENVAVFGRLTYTSTKLRRTVTSPLAVFCKVHDGEGDVHAIHGGHLRHSSEFSFGRVLEVPERSSRRRSRNLINDSYSSSKLNS